MLALVVSIKKYFMIFCYLKCQSLSNLLGLLAIRFNELEKLLIYNS